MNLSEPMVFISNSWWTTTGTNFRQHEKESDPKLPFADEKDENLAKQDRILHTTGRVLKDDQVIVRNQKQHM